MANRQDTTTTLNAPTVAGGAVMDESLRYQSDGATQAVAPRVVTTHDDGRVPGDGIPGIPVADEGALEVLGEIRAELRLIRALLMAVVNG
jgi:hypothetical protein